MTERTEESAKPLSGKVALVTGGALRIGRAICEALAAEGATVAIHYNGSGEAAEELASALGGRGSPHVTIQGDLSNTARCEAIVPEVIEQCGRLDLLVNNASLYTPMPIVETSRHVLEREFQVNLFAPFELLRTFANHVDRGSVVNILDTRVASNAKGSAAYSLSKKALADLTRLAALELAPGILVNAVAPGLVLPPVGTTTLPTEKIANIPAGRRIEPWEIARAVVFLLESETITGEIISVDGGDHLKM